MACQGGAARTPDDFLSLPGTSGTVSTSTESCDIRLHNIWRASKEAKTNDDSSISSFATDSKTFSSTVTTPVEEISEPISESGHIPPTVPLEGGYVALGTIALRSDENSDSESDLVMESPFGNEPYPNHWTSTAVRKGWLRLNMSYSSNGASKPYLRVYALPEDIDRRNRGSLKDFRKVMKHLLSFVNRSAAAWLGTANDNTTYQAYKVPKSSQEESLFYIFNTLHSPCPNLDCFHTSTYGYQAVSDVMNDTILGLKTELYPYQRRSIAAMIQREAEPAKILDPRKPVFYDVYDRQFYLDINDGALLKNPPLYNEPQGGILAETMGYGKTLICIALILATRGHYPKIPEGRVDSLPYQPREKAGSLLAMAARRTKHEGVPWKNEFYALKKQGYQYDRCLEELKKYDRAYAEPIFTPTTPDRKGKRESANRVRICSATLIIVPPNLLTQWQNEISKHTESDALDVLIVDAPTKEIPSWQELVKYDIVIITKARFEQEYRDDDLNQGKTKKGDARYRSSLTDVRWLRVICDEGHGFAGSSSRTTSMAMLDKMFIERRWVVSGTPSSTLHGVEVGLSTTNSSSTENALSTSSSAPDPVVARKSSLNSALQKRRTPSARELELKDLDRLRLIVVNFLRLQPWANQRGSSDVANWKKYLAPFQDSDGNYYTSPALRDVLQTLIIRHRIEDIDTDLTLPPLHNRIVYLEPSYHDKLAINMFFLVLTSNYVTSEREDEDYMFHPRNRKKLDLLINNLRQASFHWVGFSEHDIRETLRISNEYLNNKIDKISDDDGVLLTEAILNGERALADPSWRAFSTLHEIGVYVNRFPQHAREAWALDGRGDDPVLLGTVQAREAQRYLKETVDKGSSDALSGLAGAGVRAMNAAKSRAEDEQKAQQNAKSKLNEAEKPQVGATEEPKLKAPSASLVSSRSTPRRSVSVTPKKKQRTSIGKNTAQITPPPSPNTILQLQPIPTPRSGLSDTTISSFTSSKLTYLTSRLLSLPSSTKSLVFYQHNNTAFFIAEALELLSIPFRIYANTLSVAQRNTYLADFNSDSSDIKVLLMDVKQASHGLHVACASYVCIVSPIWEASVESQAIKRAHRIGQTREVVVETLVLKDSFEEEMVRRRKWKDEHFDLEQDIMRKEDEVSVDQESTSTPSTSNATDTKKAKSRATNAGKGLLDDRHMVSVLKDIKFMKFSREEEDVRGRVKEMDAPKDKRLLFEQALVSAHAAHSKSTIQDREKPEAADDDFGERSEQKNKRKNKQEDRQKDSGDQSDLRAKFRKLDTASAPTAKTVSAVVE